MSNDEAGSKKMDLGEEHKGEIWHEITGNIQQEITLDEKGSGEFSVNTRNIAVWIKELKWKSIPKERKDLVYPCSSK